MKTAMNEIKDKVDRLLAILDEDIQHLQDNISTLNELRGFVIKRDDVSLQKLLENVQSESNSYKENELKRRLLREQLAAALGCSFAQVTLSKLETALSGEKKTEIAQRKIKLQTLAGKLKIEHSSTVMLLSDCARFNSMLLKGILEVGQTGTITYSSRGSTERQINPALMNLQF
jgi:PAB1-binding protein PBP1